MTNNQKQIIRLPEVMQRTGLGRSSIYKFMANDTFPKSVRIGPRAIGWLSTEVDEWINTITKPSHYAE